MEFRDIELSDREWMEKYLKTSDYRGCEYSFGNLYIWKDLYCNQAAEESGMLCVRSKKLGSRQWQYLFPIGEGDFQVAVEAMRADAAKRGENFVLRGLGKTEADRLYDVFGERFNIESNRAEWDYLYKVEDLALLAGRKYHKKRNHIAKFEKSGEWHFELLGRNNMEACRKMCETWYGEHAAGGNTAALMDRSVVDNAFEYFERLGLTGGVLYQHGQVVGFTIGEPLNSDTYVVHVEKAFADVSGAYPMINREYVKSVMQGYTYVNREEDDGLEGLRKAKESYYPIMLEKFVAREVR